MELTKSNVFLHQSEICIKYYDATVVKYLVSATTRLNVILYREDI